MFDTPTMPWTNEDGTMAIEYGLLVALPRVAHGSEEVIYETKSLRRKFGDDGAAIRWAKQTVAHECRLNLGGRNYLAAPISLWRIEPDSQRVDLAGL